MSTANLIRQNRLFFDGGINPERLRALFKYAYFHPDKRQIQVLHQKPVQDEITLIICSKLFINLNWIS